ncbi:hypothetical protein [Aphanothece microscopica]|uniref:hypothetical protein n=1 Tax=Aphanothece microscopica TaxID=1049561 RepID=UPI003CE47208
MLPYHERITQLQTQIRPLAVQAARRGCSAEQQEELLARLIPLYDALFALQEELDLN